MSPNERQLVQGLNNSLDALHGVQPKIQVEAIDTTMPKMNTTKPPASWCRERAKDLIVGAALLGGGTLTTLVGWSILANDMQKHRK